MSRIVILGATSAIALATARLFSRRGAKILLVGRDENKLTAVKDDLIARSAGGAECIISDLADCSGHEPMLDDIWQRLGGVDIVLIAYGILGDQKRGEEDFITTRRIIDTNYTSAVSLLTGLANRMEKQGSGCIAVISSVAGDRGRRSNYIYGSAKAGLTAYLSGLRGRLAAAGVTVLTVKPGFVDTPMTREFKKGFLWARPEAIARGIVRAVDRKKNVAYLPSFWYPIMFIVRHIPERIFKKLNL